MRKNDLYKYYDESIVYKTNISIETMGVLSGCAPLYLVYRYIKKTENFKYIIMMINKLKMWISNKEEDDN